MTRLLSAWQFSYFGVRCKGGIGYFYWFVDLAIN
jgi:hypothetical protein